VYCCKKGIEDFEVMQVFPSLGKKSLCLNARQIDNAAGEQKLILVALKISPIKEVEEGLAEAERLLSESKETIKFLLTGWFRHLGFRTRKPGR